MLPLQPVPSTVPLPLVPTAAPSRVTPGPAVSLSGKAQARAEADRFDNAVLNQGHCSGSIREYEESRSGMGVSGARDIRESGPTGYPGYLRGIRDISESGSGMGVSGSRPDLPDSTQLGQWHMLAAAARAWHLCCCCYSTLLLHDHGRCPSRLCRATSKAAAWAAPPRPGSPAGLAEAAPNPLKARRLTPMTETQWLARRLPGGHSVRLGE